MSDFSLSDAAYRAAWAQRKILRVAVILFCAALLAEYVVGRYWVWTAKQRAIERAAAPASDWFEMGDFRVQDARQGDDPQVTVVERIFKFDGKMTMDWEAAVYVKDTNELLCFGRGFSPNYSKQSTVPLPVDLLAWWLDRREPENQCVTWPFPVGETCVFTKWHFTPPTDQYGEWPQKTTVQKEHCWNTLPAD